MSSCPCKSNQEYAACCGLYLTQGQVAPTAVALMRSRYTAYTRADVDYLIKTWDPSTCPPLSKAELQQMRWISLKIIASKAGLANDDTGIVEFIAYYKLPNGKVAQLHERSRFCKKAGVWLYQSAE
jgi:SEC-C motif domain protein